MRVRGNALFSIGPRCFVMSGSSIDGNTAAGENSLICDWRLFDASWVHMLFLSDEDENKVDIRSRNPQTTASFPQV